MECKKLHDFDAVIRIRGWPSSLFMRDWKLWEVKVRGECLQHPGTELGADESITCLGWSSSSVVSAGGECWVAARFYLLCTSAGDAVFHSS